MWLAYLSLFGARDFFFVCGYWAFVLMSGILYFLYIVWPDGQDPCGELFGANGKAEKKSTYEFLTSNCLREIVVSFVEYWYWLKSPLHGRNPPFLTNLSLEEKGKL